MMYRDYCRFDPSDKPQTGKPGNLNHKPPKPYTREHTDPNQRPAANRTAKAESFAGKGRIT